MAEKRVDFVTNEITTGHNADGIEELNTPLPRWWLWTFYITIIWGVIYTLAYPAWPMVSRATNGFLDFSTRVQVAETIARHDAKNKDLIAELLAVDFGDFDVQSDIYRYAAARGASVFRAQCSQCHGSGAAGSIGYPNLLDDDWLWGGTLIEITRSVRHGIRNLADDEARSSEMPKFGEFLSKDEISKLVLLVQNLSNNNYSQNSEAALLFAENCSSCHGTSGQGDRAVGAPNLNDAIWLYGGDEASIKASITNGRFGVMPAWGQRLSETDVLAVSIYLHSLGGGE